MSDIPDALLRSMREVRLCLRFLFLFYFLIPFHLLFCSIFVFIIQYLLLLFISFVLHAFYIASFLIDIVLFLIFFKNERETILNKVINVYLDSHKYVILISRCIVLDQ